MTMTTSLRSTQSRNLLTGSLAVFLVTMSLGCTSLSGMWSKKTPAAGPANSDLTWGLEYEKSGNNRLARDAYMSAVQKEPNSAMAHHRLAVVCDRLGLFDQAWNHYHRAIELAPNNPDVYNDLGYSYYLSGRPQEAEQVLRDCLAMNPQNQRAHNNLGMVLGRLGREAESLEQFRLGGEDEDQAAASLAFVRPRQESELATASHERPSHDRPTDPVRLEGIDQIP